jgi:hypothetical protein
MPEIRIRVPVLVFYLLKSRHTENIKHLSVITVKNNCFPIIPLNMGCYHPQAESRSVGTDPYC